METLLDVRTSEERARRDDSALTGQERFLRACRGEPVGHPPVWMMRQAGRALPEYRALRQDFTFLELVRNPELAAEVTLQPVRRFGFDAAIVFSDILVIPEAMGQRYFFRESGGVEMEFALRTPADIRRLDGAALAARLAYVPAALRLVRRALGRERALIGFAGSPWTLANFMLDGGSSARHTGALDLVQADPAAFHLLMEKLTAAVIEFLRIQIAAGADAVQIFDSLGGLLPADRFNAGSGQWLRRIVAALDHAVPVILFSKGTRNWADLAASGADVIGVDHGIGLAEAAAALPDDLALQGNLDPAFLLGEPSAAAAETHRLVAQMDGRDGWIFNLGHGMPPAANLESVGAVIETLRHR